jgi:hypothetical protein
MHSIPIPTVLPEVRLFNVSPGWLRPDFSASWTIRRPWQSLTEPPALVFAFDVDVAGEVG